MVQHPCWAPPDHGIGSICLYGLEVQELDSMHWWDRTKNLWHRTDDPEKAPQTLNYHQNCPCSSGVIFSPVRSQWFANGIRHANKNPFKLWRGDFFEGHELDSFQSMHGCGPPDIPSHGEPLRPYGLFFLFGMGLYTWLSKQTHHLWGCMT